VDRPLFSSLSLRERAGARVPRRLRKKPLTLTLFQRERGFQKRIHRHGFW
jgi:hypothetical protein